MSTDTPITDANWKKSESMKDFTRALVMRNRSQDFELAANALAKALIDAGKRCCEIHHRKGEMHQVTSDCPAEERIKAALAQWAKLKGDAPAER